MQLSGWYEDQSESLKKLEVSSINIDEVWKDLKATLQKQIASLEMLGITPVLKKSGENYFIDSTSWTQL